MLANRNSNLPLFGTLSQVLSFVFFVGGFLISVYCCRKSKCTREEDGAEGKQCLAVPLNSHPFHAAAAQYSYCLWQGRLGESRVNPPGVWG